jgi:hypothetical protein
MPVHDVAGEDAGRHRSGEDGDAHERERLAAQANEDERVGVPVQARQVRERSGDLEVDDSRPGGAAHWRSTSAPT